jgi:hypothetical protein
MRMLSATVTLCSTLYERKIFVALPALPGWVGWLLVIAVILLFIFVGKLSGDLRRVTSGKVVPRSRQELEAAYRSGFISRDDYDWWKERLQG